jgi:hypothetical protein
MEKEMWYQSKGVWGSLIVMAMGVLQSMNIDSVGPVSIDAMTAEKDTLIETLTQLGVMAGGVFAMWGRLTAKKEIKFKKGKP